MVAEMYSNLRGKVRQQSLEEEGSYKVEFQFCEES